MHYMDSDTEPLHVTFIGDSRVRELYTVFGNMFRKISVKLRKVHNSQSFKAGKHLQLVSDHVLLQYIPS